MDQEQITLEIDERPAVAAADRANRGLQSVESRAANIGVAGGKAFERMGETIVRISDRSRSSIDRLVASVEKQAQVYGKTGVERLIAQRDQLIQRLGAEQQAVERVTAAYAKMISAEQHGVNGGSFRPAESGGFSARYAIFGAKDLLEGRFTFALAEYVNELTRIGGATAGIGAAVGAIGALSAASLEAVRSLAEYGEQIRDVGLRTGLSAREVEQFGFAARAVGQDVSIFERGMRGLTQAVLDDSEAGEKARKWLTAFGVDVRGVRDGSVSTSQVFEQIAQGVNALPTPLERSKALLDLFKRSGIEMVPVMEELSRNLNIAREHGWGPTDDETRRFQQYDERLKIAAENWRQIGLNIKEALALPAAYLLSVGSSGESRSGALSRIVNGKLVAGTRPAFGGEEPLQPIPGVSYQNRLSVGLPDLSYRNRLSVVSEADAEVLRYQAGLGAEDRLRQAERALGQLAHPQLGISSVKDVEAYRAAEKLVEQRKAEVDAMKQAIEAQKEYVHGLQSETKALVERLGAASGKMFAGSVQLFGVPNAGEQAARELELRQLVQSARGGPRTIEPVRMDRDFYSMQSEIQKQQADEMKDLEQSQREQLRLAKELDMEIQRQHDEIARTAEGLSHTLFTNPHAFGRQFSTTLRDAALHPIEQGIGNLTANLLQPILFGGTRGGSALTDVRPLNGTVPVTIVSAPGIGGVVGVGTSVFSSFGALSGGSTLSSVPDYTGGLGPLSFPGIASAIGSSVGGASFGSPSFGLPMGTANGGGLFGGLGSLLGGPGGTSGFVGPVGGSGGGGFNLGGLFGGFSNLGGFVYNSSSIPLGPGSATTAAGIGGFAGHLAGVASSPAAFMGGMFLAQNGLLGSNRGTGLGVAEGTLGGALMGMKLGGPVGAAVGAAAGFGIGLGEMLAGVEPEWKKVERVIGQLYHISINKQTADQIIAIAKQTYGGNDEMAMRSPEVRQMLGLYAAGTGQAGQFRGFSSLQPHGASLVEAGGRLLQQATYQYGNPYTYQSSLPVYGGGSPGMYPNPPALQLALSVSGSDAAKFMTGQYVTPEFVGSQYSHALAASSGRMDNALALSEPGSIVS